MEVLQFGYRIPFLQVPPLSKEPIPMASYSPTSTKAIAQEEVTISCRERGGRTSSSSFSGLLQPDVRCLEDLRVMETSDRPLGLQSFHFKDSLQDGDHLVGSCVSSSGRLDGLHRSQGSILASPRPPGLSQVPAVCGLRQALPVLGSLLRPLHGSPGLHQGYGSNLDHSLQSRHSYVSIPRRLAYSSQLSRGSSPALSTVLSLCRELGVVVNPEKSNFVPAQKVQYLGTVLDAKTFRASPSRERINKLMSLGDVFLSSRLQPASTWLSLLGTLSSFSHLVPGGRLRMRALQITLHRSWDRLDDSFLISWSDDCLQGLRSWMDPERLLRGVSVSTLTRLRLLVRRVRRRLGCSPRSRSRFRPLVSVRGFSFHKREGAVSCGEGSPPFSLLRQTFHGRSVCRQLHSRGLSSQRMGHSISGPQFQSPAYPPMVGTPPCSLSSPVHHGKLQCSG